MADDNKVDDRTCIDFPRINFYGVFRSNTGTGNNLIYNYKVAMENKSGAAEQEISQIKSGGYQYDGDMTFNWTNCKITAAYGEDGKEDVETYKNFQINPSDRQVSGRLTDLGMSFFSVKYTQNWWAGYGWLWLVVATCACCAVYRPHTTWTMCCLF